MTVTRCLLIDDDADDQEFFEIALKSIDENIECLFANDGLQGLKILEKEKNNLPDFVFIDLNLPRMNGKECLAIIKNDPAYAHLSTIVISTSSDPGDIAETRRLGASDYIVKPPKTSTLISRLQNIFNK